MKIENNKLNKWREKAGITWEEFAGKVGISRMGLFKILNGKTKDIKLSTIITIQNLTGLTLEDYAPHLLSKEYKKVDAFNKTKKENNG